MVRTDCPAPTAWVGIDVSQHTLDACLLPAPGGKARTASFDNTSDGHATLAAWADEHARGAVLGFCLESTGVYGEALATCWPTRTTCPHRRTPRSPNRVICGSSATTACSVAIRVRRRTWTGCSRARSSTW